MNNQNGQVQSLQLFRGLAALSVVLSHAIQSTDAFIGNVPNFIRELVNVGGLGVDFFFVLSGFIIMYIHQSDNRTFHNSKVYLYKRFTRVFPIYWPIAFVVGLGYFVFPSMSESSREISLVSSILLLPAEGKPVLSVAWTLIHELIFYSVFLLYFISSKIFYVFLTMWLLMIVAFQFINIESGWYSYF